MPLSSPETLAAVVFDAKGDLIVATAPDTPARLAVGTNNQVLIADSAATTGLRWGAQTAGGSSAASAVSYAGGTGMSATDVEAAIDELAAGKANAADVATDAELAVQTARIDALATAVFNDRSVSYTLLLADAGKIVGIGSTSANTLTIPLEATEAFPIGTTITYRQRNIGQTAVAGATGVTVNSRGGALKLAGQYAYATLVKIAVNTWELSGDLVV